MEYHYSDRIKDLKGNAIREIFKLLSEPNFISFAGGFPTKSLLPTDEVRDITSYLMSSDEAEAILQYGSTEGYMPFRETAVEYVKRYGIDGMDVDNTLIVSGGQQTIDLMCKAFINKGDVMLVENPTYLAALHILKTYEGVAVGVESGDDGLDIADLEAKIVKYQPKILYVVPTFSNPTGRTYSIEKRRAIAEITAKYNVMVLEDDPYSELRFEGERVPSLKHYAIADNVVYTTSFSKTVAPGLRTGIAVGPKEVMRKLTIGKQAVDVHTAQLSQAILNEYIKRGLIDERLKVMIPVYREKKNAMIEAIERYMPKEFEYTNPEGGLFIFGRFDESLGIDCEDLFKKVCESKVAYVSGVSFYADGSGRNTIRLNYSNASLEEIDTGIKRLGDFFKSELESKKTN